MKKTITKTAAVVFLMILTSVILGNMLTLVLTDTMRGDGGRIPVDFPKITAIEVLTPLIYPFFAYIGKRKHRDMTVYKLMSE